MYNDDIVVLEAQLDEAKSENEELTTQVTSLTARVETLTEATESLLAMLDAIQGAVVAMMDQIDPRFRSSELESFSRRQEEIRRKL